MMPPADTAISMPGMPNGAKPWIVRFAGLKNVNSTAITASGTMNEDADDVVRLRERLHARIVQVKEEAQQRGCTKPAERGRVARSCDGQARKPRGRMLARGDDFDRDQARKGDQRDEAHQVAEQRAVREHRVADHAARARAEFAVDDAEQQHREAAEQPREDAGRRDRRHVTRGEQPPRTENGAETDEREIGQRQLFLELAVTRVGVRGTESRTDG